MNNRESSNALLIYLTSDESFPISVFFSDKRFMFITEISPDVNYQIELFSPIIVCFKYENKMVTKPVKKMTER